MKPVLHHILQLKRRYATLPFFQHLRDESLTPRERLAFFPCMAPFIMSFGDLNRHVLRQEPSDDPHQRMLNAHSHEDDHHWPWYLEDFHKLGHDRHAQPPSRPATRCASSTATRPSTTGCCRTGSRTCCGARCRRCAWPSSKPSRKPATCCSR